VGALRLLELVGGLGCGGVHLVEDRLDHAARRAAAGVVVGGQDLEVATPVPL
jgi:hypothetical protein